MENQAPEVLVGNIQEDSWAEELVVEAEYTEEVKLAPGVLVGNNQGDS